MIAVTSNYLSLVKSLPADAATMLRNVSWQEYEILLNEITDDPRLRLSYDNGTLQIMTISREHEEVLAILRKLIGVLEDTLRVQIQSYGSATHKNELQQKGVEPGDYFYIKNASRVIGKKIDLRTDPPPDLAIEVDFFNPSLSKFPIYAALQVPELWRYKNDEVNFFVLNDDVYKEVEKSSAFPFLSAETLTHFLSLGITDGQTSAKWAFADWVKANHK